MLSKPVLKKLQEGERDGFRTYDDLMIKSLVELKESDPVEYCRQKSDAAKKLGISPFDLDKLVQSEQFKPQQEDNRGFKLIKASEFTAKAPEWLVHGLIEDNTIGLFFGDSGSGKTFLAVDFALCVATGTPFHGKKIIKQGPVVYILGEGKNGFSRRMQAWSINNGYDYQDALVYVSNMPAAFLHYKSLKQAAEEIAKIKPALIVIDTLARNYGPGDENSTADMNRFIDALDEIRRPHKATVMIIHHTGHGEKHRGRGSYALTCGVDFEFEVRRERNGTVILQCKKMKDAEEPEPLAFEPQTIKMIDDEGQHMTSLAFELIEDHKPTKGISRPLTGARKKAYDVLYNLCQDGDGKVHINVWRDAAYKAGISVSTIQGTKQKAFNRAVKELMDWEVIGTENDFYWIIPDIRT
jgi:hypothetical protein